MRRIGLGEEFYERYGKHIRFIEILLILGGTLFFALLPYLKDYAPFNLYAWLTVMFLGISIHLTLFLRVARRESYPYETLWLERFRLRFFGIVLGSFIVLMVYSSLLYNWLATIIQRETLSIVTSILSYVFFVVFPMFFVSLFLVFGTVSYIKRARLSFKTVLNGLELMNNEKSQNKKMKLFRKYVMWFKVGLHSYNSYLYGDKPTYA
jgi:hypothetical protein